MSRSLEIACSCKCFMHALTCYSTPQQQTDIHIRTLPVTIHHIPLTYHECKSNKVKWDPFVIYLGDGRGSVKHRVADPTHPFTRYQRKCVINTLSFQGRRSRLKYHNVFMILLCSHCGRIGFTTEVLRWLNVRGAAKSFDSMSASKPLRLTVSHSLKKTDPLNPPKKTLTFPSNYAASSGQ